MNDPDKTPTTYPPPPSQPPMAEGEETDEKAPISFVGESSEYPTCIMLPIVEIKDPQGNVQYIPLYSEVKRDENGDIIYSVGTDPHNDVVIPPNPNFQVHDLHCEFIVSADGTFRARSDHNIRILKPQDGVDQEKVALGDGFINPLEPHFQGLVLELKPPVPYERKHLQEYLGQRFLELLKSRAKVLVEEGLDGPNYKKIDAECTTIMIFASIHHLRFDYEIVQAYMASNVLYEEKMKEEKRVAKRVKLESIVTNLEIERVKILEDEQKPASVKRLFSIMAETYLALRSSHDQKPPEALSTLLPLAQRIRSKGVANIMRKNSFDIWEKIVEAWEEFAKEAASEASLRAFTEGEDAYRTKILLSRAVREKIFTYDELGITEEELTQGVVKEKSKSYQNKTRSLPLEDTDFLAEDLFAGVHNDEERHAFEELRLNVALRQMRALIPKLNPATDPSPDPYYTSYYSKILIKRILEAAPRVKSLLSQEQTDLLQQGLESEPESKK